MPLSLLQAIEHSALLNQQETRNEEALADNNSLATSIHLSRNAEMVLSTLKKKIFPTWLLQNAYIFGLIYG